MSWCTDYQSVTEMLNGSRISTEPGRLILLTSQRGSGDPNILCHFLFILMAFSFNQSSGFMFLQALLKCFVALSFFCILPDNVLYILYSYFFGLSSQPTSQLLRCANQTRQQRPDLKKIVRCAESFKMARYDPNLAESVQILVRQIHYRVVSYYYWGDS